MIILQAGNLRTHLKTHKKSNNYGISQAVMIMTMRTNVDQLAKKELTLGGEVNRDFNGSDAVMH